MVVMVAFQEGAARVPTFACLVLLRALSAFVGSLVLSTGGATLGDIVRPPAVASLLRLRQGLTHPRHHCLPIKLPVVCTIWIILAFSALALGPVFGNFAAQANRWRRTMYDLLWVIGLVTLFVIFVLPETASPLLLIYNTAFNMSALSQSQANILLRRAKRLRAFTGTVIFAPSLRELREETGSVWYLWVFSFAPFRNFPGSITLANIYFCASFRLSLIQCTLTRHTCITFVYAFYYQSSETFPIVYGEVFEFSFGVQGSVCGPVSFAALLPPLISSASAALSIAIGGVLGALLSIRYQLAVMDSYYVKVGWPVNEKRLKPALVSAVIIVSTFEKTITKLRLTAWTSRATIHWMCSKIGVPLFVAANFATLRTFLTLRHTYCVRSYLSEKQSVYFSTLFSPILSMLLLFLPLSTLFGQFYVALCACTACTAYYQTLKREAILALLVSCTHDVLRDECHAPLDVEGRDEGEVRRRRCGGDREALWRPSASRRSRVPWTGRPHGKLHASKTGGRQFVSFPARGF